MGKRELKISRQKHFQIIHQSVSQYCSDRSVNRLIDALIIKPIASGMEEK